MAIALYSASALDRAAVDFFLEDKEMQLAPKNMQKPIIEISHHQLKFIYGS